MPVEIRELIIKAAIDNTGAAGQAAARPAATGSGNAAGAADMAQKIADIVLKQIKNKNER